MVAGEHNLMVEEGTEQTSVVKEFIVHPRYQEVNNQKRNHRYIESQSDGRANDHNNRCS